MRHAWHDTTATLSKAEQLSGQRQRLCLQCGAQQTRFQEQLWGRVVGYSWQPKAGRCGARRDPTDVHCKFSRPKARCRPPIGPGDRFAMVVPGVPIDRQPNGVHTVREVRDGYVEWVEGGRSGIAVVLGQGWRQLGGRRG